MSKTEIKRHSFSPRRWVSEIAKHEGTQLNNIVIPGTHHSAVDRLCQLRLLGCYAVCQELSVYEQLAAGVRFLNFNICNDYDGDILYVSHNFASKQLWPALDDVLKFLEEQKQEMVILDFKKDFDRQLSEKGITDLLEGVIKRFGKYGFVNFFNMNLPLQEHINAGRRVVLSLYFEGKDFMEKGVQSIKSWSFTNSAMPEEVVERNHGLLHRGFGQENYPRFNVNQLIVTLDGASIARLGTIRSKTRDLKAVLREKEKQFFKANVVMMDYFQPEDFDWAMSINVSKVKGLQDAVKTQAK